MTCDSDAAEHAHWLRSGDPVLFEKLIHRFERPVFGFLARMGIRAGDAEDLAQDIFLRLWTARNRYNPNQGRVSTWLWTIARNVSLNYLSQAKHQHHAVSVDTELDCDSLVTTDHATNPDATFQQREQLRQIDRAMTRLSDTDRLTLALVYADELSLTEAARLCDCTDGAFRVRLTRARQRLLKIFNENQQVIHDTE